VGRLEQFGARTRRRRRCGRAGRRLPTPWSDASPNLEIASGVAGGGPRSVRVAQHPPAGRRLACGAAAGVPAAPLLAVRRGRLFLAFRVLLRAPAACARCVRLRRRFFT